MITFILTTVILSSFKTLSDKNNMKDKDKVFHELLCFCSFFYKLMSKKKLRNVGGEMLVIQRYVFIIENTTL